MRDTLVFMIIGLFYMTIIHLLLTQQYRIALVYGILLISFIFRHLRYVYSRLIRILSNDMPYLEEV